MGKIATNILASGRDWNVSERVCTSGSQDRPYEEQHTSISIALVVEGSFQYRSSQGSELLSFGSLLLGNFEQYFECRHEYGTGDRCLAFSYTPEFFERIRRKIDFPIHRIPPIKELAPLNVRARLGILMPDRLVFEELALEFADAVLRVLETGEHARRIATAADERRVSSALRFIEANLAMPLSLELLASNVKMSEFYFLRVFKQVTGVTPHQYILRLRLLESALQLGSSSKDVLSVASHAGFIDLSNFNHAFRAEFGVNPVRFRRTIL